MNVKWFIILVGLLACLMVACAAQDPAEVVDEVEEVVSTTTSDYDIYREGKGRRWPQLNCSYYPKYDVSVLWMYRQSNGYNGGLTGRFYEGNICKESVK